MAIAKTEHYAESEGPTPGHSWVDPVIFRAIRTLQPQPSRVLDLGCGNGALTVKLKRAGFDVLGLDPSPEQVRRARASYPDVRFEVGGIYDEPKFLGLADFDLVVCEEVVEHLYYPRELPRFAKAALHKDGHLIVTTPYYGYLRNLLLAIFNRWDHHLTPLWEHGHIKLFSRRNLCRLLEEGGFAVMKFYGAANIPYLWRNQVVVARPEDPK
jgi:2-polyprenyl-3-methyl-5-hydroxy-6-metoxy-1,4-benzoquinol methylase